MPTERFYRLSEEKQLAIRDAAMKEFIRVPFEKASINQIIQKAEISRGSFYTYFEDKRDLLRYIFKDTKKRTQDFCRSSLNKHRGSLWLMLEDLLEYGFEYHKDNDIFRLSQHVMLYAETENLMEKVCFSDDEGKPGNTEEWLFKNVDRSELKELTAEEFHMLMDICMALLMTSIARYSKEHKSKAEVKKAFAWKIKTLKQGICKS